MSQTSGSTTVELRDWAARFAREQSEHAQTERFVDRVDSEIIGAIPEIAADPVLVKDLHASTRHQWLAFLALLTQPEHQLVLPEQAGDLARSLARRGHDLGILLKVYRAAHRGVFGHFSATVDELDDGSPPPDEVLKFVWNRADLWIDDSIEQLIETYYAARQELHEGLLERRAAMVEALLAAEPMSSDEATTALGHAMLQWQTACVVWAADTRAGLIDDLASTAADIAAALGGTRPLTHLAGSRDLWCWVATPHQPDLAALADIAGSLAQRGVTVSVGMPGPGVEGFRSGHLEAKAAQHLCLELPQPPQVVNYRDVELLCLAADSGPLLHRMVHREVGALCGPDKNLAQLRDTALAYLTNRMNIEAAAAQLFVHKNTVRYRLARVEELLGHPLTERAANVELALRYVAFLGPAPKA